MKPLYQKLLIALAITAVLAAAFWWGGRTPGSPDGPAGTPTIAQSGQQQKLSEQTGNAGQPNSQPDISQPRDDAEDKTTAAPPAGPAADNSANPSSPSSSQQALDCTLAVRCDTILAHLDTLDEAKQELIPSDGVILASRSVSFSEGESVLDVLLRELQAAGIPMEYVNTPGYGSAYIEGINNIYEMDCGSLSGWMYRVNGVFPGYGCSLYLLEDGDRVEVLYSCDLGADIGGGSAAGGEQ